MDRYVAFDYKIQLAHLRHPRSFIINQKQEQWLSLPSILTTHIFRFFTYINCGAEASIGEPHPRVEVTLETPPDLSQNSN